MIPTIPQDALLGFALTQVVALSGARTFDLSARLWQRPFQEALVFLLAVFLPASYSFFHFWPDWSWLYLLDPESASPAWTVLGFGGIVALGAGGYVLARALLVRGHRRAVHATIALALLGVALIAALLGDRFLYVGTAEELARGSARPLYAFPAFGAHFAVVTAFVTTALAVILVGHRRQRREGP